MRSAILVLIAAGSLACAGEGPATVSGDGYPVVVDRRPMLGIEMTPPGAAALDREGLGPNTGVLVQSTYPGTAAAGMGVQPGDIITAVNGNPIDSMTTLRNEVGMGNVGDPIDVVVSRGGRQIRLNDQLREWPASIPYEPIDPAAERRFREWQQRRVQEQQAQVEQLNQGIADAARRLGVDPASLGKGEGKDEPGARKAAGQDASDPAALPPLAALAVLPAWQLRVSIDAAKAAPVAAPEIPAELEALPLPAGAWRFTYTIASL